MCARVCVCVCVTVILLPELFTGYCDYRESDMRGA